MLITTFLFACSPQRLPRAILATKLSLPEVA
jgi:hypothetical protein